MKQVLYPKYLLGGMMQPGGGIGAAERGESDGLGGSLRGLAGRWPDADVILQSGMSEGLRDWDLWGPLIFCLLLSLFLSWGAAGNQRDLVFSGVFAMVWIGEAVVTMQIKLLGGNMYVGLGKLLLKDFMLTSTQCLLPICLHHRLHALPARHRLTPECSWDSRNCQDTCVSCAHCLVSCSWREHFGRKWSGQEPRWHRCIPSICFLHRTRMPLLY